MRPYQAETMRSLDHALELGKRRFLIELPTGTGKTDLICLYLKRLFKAGWAERMLVLVDREQLAKQALDAIQDVLAAYSSYWLRPGMARQEQQITVALLQTMIGRVDDYTAGCFDVVIADDVRPSGTPSARATSSRTVSRRASRNSWPMAPTSTTSTTTLLPSRSSGPTRRRTGS